MEPCIVFSFQWANFLTLAIHNSQCFHTCPPPRDPIHPTILFRFNYLFIDLEWEVSLLPGRWLALDFWCCNVRNHLAFSTSLVSDPAGARRREVFVFWVTYAASLLKEPRSSKSQLLVLWATPARYYFANPWAILRFVISLVYSLLIFNHSFNWSRADLSQQGRTHPW